MSAGAPPTAAARRRSYHLDMSSMASHAAEQLTRSDTRAVPHPQRSTIHAKRVGDAALTTSVGRIRDDPALENGMKYLLVSHNTKMGAAKGAVLAAEYLATTGYL